MTATAPEKNKAFHTEAGDKFRRAVTEWLQDTRLLSEAAFRLYSDHKKTRGITFSDQSWPKPKKDDPPELPVIPFEMKPGPLTQRMNGLLKSLWRSQFIFLESLWEEYLQDLVLELRLRDASIFEPFCEQKFMAGIVRDVLCGNLESIENIKDEAAARFAAGITRQPWAEQWAQLSRLEIGLSKSDAALAWFTDLDVYFEMRNCIIHRQCRVSPLLEQKTAYYRERDLTHIEIWPQHIDYYRRKFLDCVKFIESKIGAKARAAKAHTSQT